MASSSRGSDTNGSIRVPAAFCGVFGLKPTYGRVSRAGAFLFSESLDHVGPLARSVRDLAVAFDAMHGPDPRDPVASSRPRESITEQLGRGAADLRIAVVDGASGGCAKGSSAAIPVLTRFCILSTNNTRGAQRALPRSGDQAARIAVCLPLTIGAGPPHGDRPSKPPARSRADRGRHRRTGEPGARWSGLEDGLVSSLRTGGQLIAEQPALKAAVGRALVSGGPTVIVVPVRREYPESAGPVSGWWDVPVPASLPRDHMTMEGWFLSLSTVRSIRST